MISIYVQKEKLMKRFFKELDIGTFFTNSTDSDTKVYLKLNDKEAYDLDYKSLDRIKSEKFFFLGYCYPLDINLNFEYLTIPLEINRANGDSLVSMSLPLCEYSLFNLGAVSNVREAVFFTFSNTGKKIPIDGIEDSHHIFIFIKPFVIYDLVKNEIIELTAGDVENVTVNVLETRIGATFKTER